MKKLLITLSALLSIAATHQVKAYWNVNFGFGSPSRAYTPVRRICRPVHYMYQPVYYVPYPVYHQPAVVHYVDCRDPEIAMIQDGFNCIFNAMSCASSTRPRRRHRR